jgi:6-phosphogluconolactonase
VALAGGSTPRAAYALLATEEFAARVDWSRVHVLWGDERCVPPDDPDSNYRMAREALLDKIPIPTENVHRIRGELPPDEAAAAYQAELEAVLGAGGRFDLVLLGMGVDGHTASLFPGTAALHEGERWVVAAFVDKLSAWRVTLTPVVLNAAAQVTFQRRPRRGQGRAAARGSDRAVPAGCSAGASREADRRSLAVAGRCGSSGSLEGRQG